MALGSNLEFHFIHSDLSLTHFNSQLLFIYFSSSSSSSQRKFAFGKEGAVETYLTLPVARTTTTPLHLLAFGSWLGRGFKMRWDDQDDEVDEQVKSE